MEYTVYKPYLSFVLCLWLSLVSFARFPFQVLKVWILCGRQETRRVTPSQVCPSILEARTPHQRKGGKRNGFQSFRRARCVCVVLAVCCGCSLPVCVVRCRSLFRCWFGQVRSLPAVPPLLFQLQNIFETHAFIKLVGVTQPTHCHCITTNSFEATTTFL